MDGLSTRSQRLGAPGRVKTHNIGRVRIWLNGGGRGGGSQCLLMTSASRGLSAAAGIDRLTVHHHFYIYGIMKSESAVAALAALAQENRLDVFRLLVQAGTQGLPAGQIADKLGIAAPTLSFHLAQLRHAGLVHQRRDGRSLIYAANYDGMNALMGFLTENCCAGDRAACLPRMQRKGARR